MTTDDSTQCVQGLAALDDIFAEENRDAIRDAAEFPHAVMMLFAGYLARKFTEGMHRDTLIIECASLVDGVLNVLEMYLRVGDDDVKCVIVDSFIEQVYDENRWLFDYLLRKAGPLLFHVMQTHSNQ